MFSSPTSPAYLSSRSADVILSDVRPIKLVYEALQSVNVLLDELLYTILNEALSLATDRLKAALLKVVPTTLGKEALLEAEVELKAYCERATATPETSRSASVRSSVAEDERPFDLQWSFELLRLKCEAYSTMNDTDEDTEAERRLNERMGGALPLSVAELAPAALYLTAILEYICEHILSNVSSVVARDSSRTIATVQDLFIALCEDDAIHGTFRATKVYDQIEHLSRATKTRRSKSFSRTSDRVSSPLPPPSTHAELMAVTESAVARARTRASLESLKSASSTAGTVERGRSSSEKGRATTIRMRLTSEQPEITEKGQPDQEGLDEFDELMRSGATMKVSLTPDRLKSMEVFNRERTLRANRRAGQISDRASGGDGHASMADRQRKSSTAARPLPRRVDSIVEDEEELPSRPSTAQPATGNRMRQSSKSFSARSSPSQFRIRAASISDMPSPRLNSGKASPAAEKPPTNGAAGRQNSRKMARNRESIDLDEIIGGSDGDEEDAAGSDDNATPTSAKPNRPKPKPPHISQSARDLIAFLEEGPPTSPDSPPRSSNASVSVFSLESTKSRSGRFSRMMSRLTASGSADKINGRRAEGDEEQPRTPRTARILGRKASMNNLHPPPSYKAPSLSSKRSFPNVVVVSPSRPYPSQAPKLPSPVPSLPSSLSSPQWQPASPVPSTAPLLPHSISVASSQASTDDSSSHAFPVRRSSVRKAVPTWDEKVEVRPPVPSLAIPADNVSVPSRNGSIRSHVNGAAVPPEDNAIRESAASPKDTTPDRIPSLSINTSITQPVNGQTLSPSPQGEAYRGVSPSPSRSRRSPIPRKPAPSPNQEEGPATPITPSSLPSTPAPTSSTLTLTPPTKDRSERRRSRRSNREHISSRAVGELRRLLAAARTADECRLLVDMFFARHGFPQAPGVGVVAAADFPEPPPLDNSTLMSLTEMECSMVEHLLGDGDVVMSEAMNAHARTQTASVDATAVNVEAHAPTSSDGSSGNAPASGAPSQE
ncbi:uncharacterized protein LAESUDRAFT_714246 [Laetiporus sulphureus 93-53]|uniref:Uncharacterized protein n=1 Tax=Laetiporus sulphureus 93-53 TaxID=1314785 RepID=A0A165E979_9APHY|nr:uncharacterized protein LAESUDRAFT_714246 [Laetiporus sulphureus 93-53]KZT06511.1 hypothetical protein LAESUDRAFT_714246 [Laetiporus sulphureus 93-53]